MILQGTTRAQSKAKYKEKAISCTYHKMAFAFWANDIYKIKSQRHN